MRSLPFVLSFPPGISCRTQGVYSFVSRIDYDSPLAPPETLGECVVTSRNAAGAPNTFSVPFQAWNVKTSGSEGEPHLMVTVSELPRQVTQFVPFEVRVVVTNPTERQQELLVRMQTDSARCAHTYTLQSAAPATTANATTATAIRAARPAAGDGRAGVRDEYRRSASSAALIEKDSAPCAEGCAPCDALVGDEEPARVAPGTAVSELCPSFLSVAPKRSASLTMLVVPLLAGVQNLTGAQALVVEERETHTRFVFGKLAHVLVTPQGWSAKDDSEDAERCKKDAAGAATSEETEQEEPQGKTTVKDRRTGDKGDKEWNDRDAGNKGDKEENDGNTGDKSDKEGNAVSVALPVASSPLSRSAIIDDSNQ